MPKQFKTDASIGKRNSCCQDNTVIIAINSNIEIYELNKLKAFFIFLSKNFLESRIYTFIVNKFVAICK